MIDTPEENAYAYIDDRTIQTTSEQFTNAHRYKKVTYIQGKILARVGTDGHKRPVHVPPSQQHQTTDI